MKSSAVVWRSIVVLIGALLLLSAELGAQGKGKQDYDALYAKYLSAARGAPGPQPLWIADLVSDPTARRLNDLVTVRVIESVVAAGSADANINKNGSANVEMPWKFDDFFNKWLPYASETKFNGAGGTSRSTEISATLTARVVEVLPSGDLVVEGVREIDINGDRHLVVLSGVIRAIDVLPGNVIPSTRIGQLRIRSLSQGLIKDSLSPGWLIRVLNKIF
jgi:flagellar L-ring protein precursor FlgH